MGANSKISNNRNKGHDAKVHLGKSAHSAAIFEIPLGSYFGVTRPGVRSIKQAQKSGTNCRTPDLNEPNK